MDISDMLKNDAKYVEGFSDAIDEVNWLIHHSENPVESLKLWVKSQGILCDELDAMRNIPLPGMPDAPVQEDDNGQD